MTFRIVPYDEISKLMERSFNHPELSDSFTRDDFAHEYDNAFNTIAEELSAVALVNATGLGDGDFTMYRYVDLNRAIMVVADTAAAISPDSLRAAHSALQRLPTEYVVGFDAHPTYVCIRRDGSVIGCSDDSSTTTLLAFGFPKSIV